MKATKQKSSVRGQAFSTYNDKVPHPSTSRVENAFSKYLILGEFSEIQLISPGDIYREPGHTMYHVFTNPDLKSCTTVTIERKSTRLAWVTLKVNRGHESEPTGPDAEKTRVVWAKTDNLTFQIAIKGLMGDAELIKAGFAEHRKQVHMHYQYAFHGISVNEE